MSKPIQERLMRQDPVAVQGVLLLNAGELSVQILNVLLCRDKDSGGAQCQTGGHEKPTGIQSKRKTTAAHRGNSIGDPWCRG